MGWKRTPVVTSKSRSAWCIRCSRHSRRHRVEHHVLEVDGHIHGHEAEGDAGPQRQPPHLKQAPAVGLAHEGQPESGNREQQPHQQRIQHHDAEIAGPSNSAPEAPPSTRRSDLPCHHRAQYQGKRQQSDQRFVRHHFLGGLHLRLVSVRTIQHHQWLGERRVKNLDMELQPRDAAVPVDPGRRGFAELPYVPRPRVEEARSPGPVARWAPAQGPGT